MESSSIARLAKSLSFASTTPDILGMSTRTGLIGARSNDQSLSTCSLDGLRLWGGVGSYSPHQQETKKVKLQDQAIRLPCPFCGGHLRRQGRGFVRCIGCWNAYENREIVDKAKAKGVLIPA